MNTVTNELLDQDYSSLSLQDRNEFLLHLLGQLLAGGPIEENVEMEVMNETLCVEAILPLQGLSVSESDRLDCYRKRLSSTDETEYLSVDEMKDLVSLTSIAPCCHTFALMCRGEEVFKVVASELQASEGVA